MKAKLSIRSIFLISFIALVFSMSLGGQSANSEASRTITSKGKTVEAVTNFEGNPNNSTQRKDKIAIGYYIKDGSVVKKNSLLAEKDGPVSSLDLDITAKGDAINPVIAVGKGTDLTLTGVISATDDSDGKNANDFSGVGTMIIANNGAKVKVNNMKINTKGFMRAAFISSEGGQILVKDTTVVALGANPLTQAYKGFANSANQSEMLAPPWVLGIMGGIRGTNLLGNKATLTLINSSIAVGGWAVLSADDCQNPMLNVVDSTMEILPESKGGMTSGKFSYSANYGTGYGTYFIGTSIDNFYGVTMKGLTYAGIYTGGTGLYKSSNGKIELKDADGKTIETVTGKGKPTTINAVWGFMNHGDATVNVMDGTVVNAEEAIFLSKAGGATFVADNAVLNSGSGILLQMIDNDDSTVGLGSGGNMVFNTEFNEKAGWPSENGNVTKADASGGGKQGGQQGSPQGAMPAAQGGQGGMPQGGMPAGQAGGQQGGMPGMQAGGAPGGDQGRSGGPGGGGPGGPGGRAGGPVKLVLTNGAYKGNVFNGGGYYNQSGNPLEVSIGKGATLNGAISLTETRHIDEKGKQNTHFTINEYYYLGHVENRNYRNGNSTIEVTLKDGGKWAVTGESFISKLIVDKGAIEGANGAKVVMKIDGKETPIKEGITYKGKIVISLAK
jgi:hypothetical protein